VLTPWWQAAEMKMVYVPYALGYSTSIETLTALNENPKWTAFLEVT
jgi:hypothetical protein